MNSNAYSSGKTVGTRVQLYTCNSTGAQLFIVQNDGQIENPNSGKCVGAEKNPADAAYLFLQDCGTNNSDNATYWSRKSGEVPSFPSELPSRFNEQRKDVAKPLAGSVVTAEHAKWLGASSFPLPSLAHAISAAR
ncbi:ricin-type beta-trefoil lectin domain protein [Streptomyces sp. NPDC055709]